MPTIDREYLMEDWGSYLGNNAYTPEITKQLFKGSGYSRSYDDALDDISTALQSGDYGYPEPQHEAAYHEILDDDDWKEIAREAIEAHLEGDFVLECLWDWNDYNTDINEIAGRAVWGNDPYWKVAYELGMDILDNGFTIFDVKGDEGVTGAYDKVIPLTPEIQGAVKKIRFLQAYAHGTDMTDNIVNELQDNRDTIIEAVMKLVTEE